MNRLSYLGLAAFLVTSAVLPQAGADDQGDQPGHSIHGEAFNEGPRQKAYVMTGTGKVDLPINSKNKEAQAFFNQGVGQLHGFWFFEAERSFRQVAALDPDCAMAYWGMALANINNTKRAKEFFLQAVERKAGASLWELMWIGAYADFWLGTKAERDRRQDLIRALETISLEFPDELEVKAFLAFHIWDNSEHGIPIQNRASFDALLKDILAVEPMHPVHHYRIHLWDNGRANLALDSAARCGQSAPDIAHMWHMSGHTFTRLHRYSDAVWQQEAAARVDHRHMMHDRVLPDQIHNYVHNNQWLVENYEYIGRAHDAVALAKNLIELPRHPRYNTLGMKDDGKSPERNSGSSAEGRRRLFEVLLRFELWDELIALSDTMYLEPTDLPAEQIKRLRALGVAYFSKSEAENGRKQIEALEAMLPKARSGRPGQIEAALAELRVLAALAGDDKTRAGELLDQAKEIPRDRLARYYLLAGNPEKAETLARDNAAAADKQVAPLAGYADILFRAGKESQAQEQFQKLRQLSAEVDLDLPIMQRLKPIAQSLALKGDWRVPKTVPKDVGTRPRLDDLGPIHWQPSPAPDWRLPDEQHRQFALKEYHGKPVVLIFFLGNGCPHCIEQLNAFEPLVAQYQEAGIALVAVSTDSPDDLKKTFEKSKLPAEFKLLSDQPLQVFKAYRAFDDFENQPLHATFLIDGDGLVRWQDIGFEPFTEARFLLKESKRLLSLKKS